MSGFPQGRSLLRAPANARPSLLKLALGVGVAASAWAYVPAQAAPSSILTRAASAVVAAPAPVTSKLSAWKVQQKDGAEQLVEAGRVAPGDVIEYRVEYRNAGSKVVRDLAATLPIPAAMSYVEKSNRPSQAQGSTNGRAYGPLPLRRRVKGADGSINVVAVPAAQYRFLRWNVPVLNPGQSISFVARARVNRVGAQ